MGRIYTVATVLADVDVITDLITLIASAAVTLRIHEARIGQYTDAGDANAEMLRVSLGRTGTAGTGGNVITPEELNTGDIAAVTGAREFDIAPATRDDVLLEDAFNIQAGWLYLPTPETRIHVAPLGIFVMALPVAPNTAINITASVTFEEL